jgi:hypothetical protein
MTHARPSLLPPFRGQAEMNDSVLGDDISEGWILCTVLFSNTELRLNLAKIISTSLNFVNMILIFFLAMIYG